MRLIMFIAVFFLIITTSISFSQNVWKTYKSPPYINQNGLAHNKVTAIAIDNNNGKWFGHFGLISKFDSDSKVDYVSYFDPTKEDNKWSVIFVSLYCGRAIAVDKNNKKWFNGSEGYIESLSADNKKYKTYGLFYISDRFSGYVSSILIDDNTIWFSFNWAMNHTSGGIIKYSIINDEFEYSLLYNTVNSLSFDSNKNIWAACGMGLFFYTNNEWTLVEPNFDYYVLRASIVSVDKNDIVWAVVQDYDDFKYFLIAYDGTDWSIYTTDNSGIVSNKVLSIAIDQNNTKWFGTDSGVSRFDGETWTTLYTQNSGLCDNNVNAIAVEKNNTIWFGTDNGVSRYTGEVITTSVDEEEKIPEAVPLIKSYPNPFNPATTIEFSIPQDGFVKLNIYNIAGQKVCELVAEYITAGTHSAVWDGKDESGETVSAGIYITRLKAGNHVATGKMVLVK